MFNTKGLGPFLDNFSIFCSIFTINSFNSCHSSNLSGKYGSVSQAVQAQARSDSLNLTQLKLKLTGF